MDLPATRGYPDAPAVCPVTMQIVESAAETHDVAPGAVEAWIRQHQHDIQTDDAALAGYRNRVESGDATLLAVTPWTLCLHITTGLWERERVVSSFDTVAGETIQTAYQRAIRAQTSFTDTPPTLDSPDDHPYGLVVGLPFPVQAILTICGADTWAAVERVEFLRHSLGMSWFVATVATATEYLSGDEGRSAWVRVDAEVVGTLTAGFDVAQADIETALDRAANASTPRRQVAEMLLEPAGGDRAVPPAVPGWVEN